MMGLRSVVVAKDGSRTLPVKLLMMKIRDPAAAAAVRFKATIGDSRRGIPLEDVEFMKWGEALYTSSRRKFEPGIKASKQRCNHISL